MCFLWDVSNGVPPCRVITSPYGTETPPFQPPTRIHVTMVATLMFLHDLAMLARANQSGGKRLIQDSAIRALSWNFSTRN